MYTLGAIDGKAIIYNHPMQISLVCILISKNIRILNKKVLKYYVINVSLY